MNVDKFLDTYGPMIAKSSQKHGHPELASTFAKQIYMESRGNPKARNKETGAYGLGQFIPNTLKTWKNKGYKYDTPEDMIDMSIAYNVHILDNYAGGDPRKMLVGYHSGENVLKKRAHDKPWNNPDLWPRTHNYHTSILGPVDQAKKPNNFFNTVQKANDYFGGMKNVSYKGGGMSGGILGGKNEPEQQAPVQQGDSNALLQQMLSSMMPSAADKKAAKRKTMIDSLLTGIGAAVGSLRAGSGPQIQASMLQGLQQRNAARTKAVTPSGGNLMDIYKIMSGQTGSSDIQGYNMYQQQEIQAGRSPMSYYDWDISRKKAGAQGGMSDSMEALMENIISRVNDKLGTNNNPSDDPDDAIYGDYTESGGKK